MNALVGTLNGKGLYLFTVNFLGDNVMDIPMEECRFNYGIILAGN